MVTARKIDHQHEWLANVCVHCGAQNKNYWPGPVAYEAHKSRAMVKLAWGPLGTAKTSWLCWRAWAICHRAAQHGYAARVIFIRDTYRNLMDSTFVTWQYWFPDRSALGYATKSDPVDYKLNVGDQVHDILFRHGQTEQDASMFLSTEFDGIMLEEVAPAYIPGTDKVSPGIAEGVFDMALSRLTRQVRRAWAVMPELCITCNSPPIPHWASTRVIDRDADYLRRANWAHWFFPKSDNQQNLRPDYYSNLEVAWEGKRALIQRFIQGVRLPIFIGVPRFNLDQLDRMRSTASEPGFKGFLLATKENVLGVKLEKAEQGYLKLWKPPRLGGQYVIGADVAEGIEGGDYSAAYVLERTSQEIVAGWHGHVEPEQFGDELYRLGILYNSAKIGVESFPSAHGLTALMRLKALDYPHVFYSTNLETRGRVQPRIGWRSTRATKPVMIDGIAAHLAREKGEADPVIPDLELISELQTYGIMKDGTTEAQEGCHDDRVIAYGLALMLTKIAGLEQYFPALAEKRREEMEQKEAR